MADLAKQRALIRPLLDEHSPADAMAAYYALHHDPARSKLFLHYDTARRPVGFLVRAQTGFDLFRQLVAVRARDREATASLLRVGLMPGRPYYVTLPREFGEVAFRELRVTDPEVLRLYEFDPARLKPPMNVLVTGGQAEGGNPRFEVRSEERSHAVAGVNWRSDSFAEVYVFVEPAARGRGWGLAVVSALAQALRVEGVRPLYVVAENNEASIRLATRAGFVDTRAREFSCTATLEAAEGNMDSAHG